jgi:RNA polymerase sigma-70 factor (ECF subfamily)
MNEDLEKSLITRFQSGDAAAYGELFEANHRRVVNLGLHILRNEESALDVAQEVFLRAYEELNRWRGEARFSTWLYRTALNVCFERIRADEKQRKIRDRSPGEQLAHEPEREMVNGEIMQAIRDSVQELPPRQRSIFVLKQFHELRFIEIAQLLDITEGGAKASYHKALLTLRDRLKDLAPEVSRMNGQDDVSFADDE